VEPLLLAACVAPKPGEQAKPCLDQGQSEPGGAFAVAAVVMFAFLLWVIIMRTRGHSHK
jgi:hypothetical protein